MVATNASTSPGNPACVRSRAALLATICALCLLVSLRIVVNQQVAQHIERFNTDPLPEKLTGLALQRAVFETPGLLPIYGSSELTQPQANRPDEFFRAHPTGFGAFLIGNPGETDLVIASKLAALGATAHGRKAVVFLSPGWFIVPQLDPRGFGVNFSPLQGGLIAFGAGLPADLQRDLARRLSDYSDLLAQYPMLRAALLCEARGTPLDLLLRDLMTPFGTLQIALRDELDYAKVGVWWWSQQPATANRSVAQPVASIDWAAKLREIDAAYAKAPPSTHSQYSTTPSTAWDTSLSRYFRDPLHPEHTPDDNFERDCLASKEWTDLQLLLRIAHERDIHLLIFCQPLNEKFCQLQGLTARSSDLFYHRLREEVAPYRVPVLTFPKGENNPHFYHDSVHPSAEAWLTYDEDLDAFFHAPDPS